MIVLLHCELHKKQYIVLQKSKLYKLNIINIIINNENVLPPRIKHRSQKLPLISIRSQNKVRTPYSSTRNYNSHVRNFRRKSVIVYP